MTDIKKRYLAPCPFCGCEEISVYEHYDFGGYHYAMCENCGACIGGVMQSYTEEEAIEKWNKRAVEK